MNTSPDVRVYHSESDIVTPLVEKVDLTQIGSAETSEDAYSSSPANSNDNEEYEHFISVCEQRNSEYNDGSHPTNPYMQGIKAKSGSNLACMYSTGLTSEHPFLKISPFKIEEFNKDPPIVLFHDFASDLDVEEVLKEAKGRVVYIRIHQL